MTKLHNLNYHNAHYVTLFLQKQAVPIKVHKKAAFRQSGAAFFCGRLSKVLKDYGTLNLKSWHCAQKFSLASCIWWQFVHSS